MKINKNAIIESLVYGRVLSTETFETGKRHNFRIPNFDELIFEYPNIKNVVIENFTQILKEQIEKTCKGKSEIALALSGGKDSRVLLALLHELDISPVCVTWSYQPSDPEVVAAKNICDELGLEHKYIKITPLLYFNDIRAEKLMKLAKGSPLYFDMMLWHGIKDQLDYEVVFCGNLMTEYMDTAEYRTYEGNDVRAALFFKETLADVIGDYEFNKYRMKLINFYFDENLNKIIVTRMLDRIAQYHIMRKFINWNYPILDKNVLNSLFEIPFEYRMGSKLTRHILRNHAPKLYAMPTGRSPLSLKWPLAFHQVYQKVSRRKISKGFEHILPNYLDTYNEDVMRLVNKYDFLDTKKIRNILHYGKPRYKRMVQSRLLNLLEWNEIYGN